MKTSGFIQPVLLSVGITQKCLNSFSQSVVSHHLQKLLFGDFSVAVVVGESNHLLGKRRHGLLKKIQIEKVYVSTMHAVVTGLLTLPT